MDAADRAFALARTVRAAIGGRLDPAARPYRRYMPPALPADLPETEPAAAPVVRPYIADAPDWPPVQHVLGLDEFALLPEGTRAMIATILEPAYQRLHAGIVEWLSEALRRGEPQQLAARAIAGRAAELAGLIAAVDHYNIAPDSPYRIAPRLKLFLVECAIAAVAESTAQILDKGRPSHGTIAA
jgi:hypothetical protein